MLKTTDIENSRLPHQDNPGRVLRHPHQGTLSQMLKILEFNFQVLLICSINDVN